MTAQQKYYNLTQMGDTLPEYISRPRLRALGFTNDLIRSLLPPPTVTPPAKDGHPPAKLWNRADVIAAMDTDAFKEATTQEGRRAAARSRRFVAGKTYDINNARKIMSCENETLYQKNTGDYFLHIINNGNQKAQKQGSTRYGVTFVPMTQDAAIKWAKSHPYAVTYISIIGINADAATIIKGIRASTDMSQAAFCAACDIRLTTLAQWEQGSHRPSKWLIDLLKFRADHIDHPLDGDTTGTPEVSITDIRSRTGLSCDDFADALGIPRITLRQWEAATRKTAKHVLGLLKFRINHIDEYPLQTRQVAVIQDGEITKNGF